jgi:tRNA A-37 threonylcarbamoyl transferase component Bud32/ActR/RegA family two-component response regulator
MTARAHSQTASFPEAAASLPSAGISALPLPHRLLIVGDDVAIRLHLADLLAPHCPGSAIHTATPRGAVELGARLKDYAAALVIVELAPAKGGGQPLAIVGELRALARGVSVTVLGRSGNERSAIDALRAGAIDYWPLHTVNVSELIATLRTHLVGSRQAVSAPTDGAPPQIAGYRPVKELCRSARATLYLAQSVELDAPVVLKVHGNRGSDAVSEVERERFMRECRLLAQFNHRAIADVYDFGITPECHWLALEYFPCGSLKARLQHPLSEAETVGYVRQIAEALVAVHAAGLVHRDLKPSNVMLRADDSLALIDFGLARPALRDSDVTARNVRVGSPSYMSPEQIEGLPPDHRCDLYALGILFHELLTGALPFQAETVPAILALHLRARPPRLPPHYARYQPLVDDLLAKRPPDRPASAVAFLEALAAASATAPERRTS